MSNTLTFKEIKRKPGLYRDEQYNVWFLTIYSPNSKTKHHTFWLSTGYRIEIADSSWDKYKFRKIVIGDGSQEPNIPDVAQIIGEYINMGI